MPIVAPHPVACWPSPCPGRRRAGASPAQRSASKARFSGVAGSRNRPQARQSDLGSPIMRPLSPSLRGVVQAPVVVIELELGLIAGRFDLLALVRGEIEGDEFHP